MKGKQLIQWLMGYGWEVTRKADGSHVIMKCSGNPQTVSVPCHTKPIPDGTLAQIIRKAGLKREFAATSK